MNPPLDIVLSAHADGENAELFTIPPNVQIVTYGVLGEGLVCDYKLPGQVCYGHHKSTKTYPSGVVFPNFYLWKDKKKNFYSGAKICYGEVIYNIDELPYKTIPGTEYQYNCQLQDVIESINYDLDSKKYFLHLLICLGGVDEINVLTSKISGLFVRDPSFGGPVARSFDNPFGGPSFGGPSFGGRKKRKLHKKRLSRKHKRKSNKKSKRKSKKSKRKLHKKMLTRKRKSKKNTK